MTPSPLRTMNDKGKGRFERAGPLNRLVIVDDQRRPLGIVSSTDIGAAVARVGEDEQPAF